MTTQSVVIDEISYMFDLPTVDQYKSGMGMVMLPPLGGLDPNVVGATLPIIRELGQITDDRWQLRTSGCPLSVHFQLREAMMSLSLPVGVWFHYRFELPPTPKKINLSHVKLRRRFIKSPSESNE